MNHSGILSLLGTIMVAIAVLPKRGTTTANINSGEKNLHITRLSESRVCVIVGMFQAMRNN